MLQELAALKEEIELTCLRAQKQRNGRNISFFKASSSTSCLDPMARPHEKIIRKRSRFDSNVKENESFVFRQKIVKSPFERELAAFISVYRDGHTLSVSDLSCHASPPPSPGSN